MLQLPSWNVAELRKLARELRRRADGSSRNVELMLFTAAQLDAEASRQERSRLGQHFSILV